MFGSFICRYRDIVRVIYDTYGKDEFLFKDVKTHIKSYNMAMHRKFGFNDVLVKSQIQFDGRIAWKLSPSAIRWIQNDYKV